jgi:pimeloyl-ACP methyl ester carboxylesterase
MSGTYFSDGAALKFVDTGTGMPVVFLHPTPLDHDYWRPMIDDLPRVRAIVPDLRGHGASELGESLPQGEFSLVRDAEVLSMTQLARDIRALLSALNVYEAAFVGCSIGGYVMLELWRQASQSIRGMAFVCSKPQADTPQAMEKRAANITLARKTGASGLFDGMTQTLIGATSRRQRPTIVSEIRARMTISTDAFVAVQAGLATRPDSLPTVPEIRVPVLAIAGGEDPGVTPDEMRAFGAASGGCRFEVLPDAGHFAAFEQPQKVAGILAEWLQSFER